MRFRLPLFCVALVVLVTPHAVAQRTLRDSALALFNDGRQNEARPLLEQLAKANPADRLIQERLGFSLLQSASAPSDAKVRKEIRARARSHFAKAVELGSTDLVVTSMLEVIRPDGGEDVEFSSNKQVDQAMKQAEAAYSTGDFRAAIVDYQRALAFDGQMYAAALFTGDAYLKLKLPDSAYIWYRKATVINPDKETAWRYWSDVLVKNGQLDEARDKAIEAVVAEPYNRLSRQGLVQWAPDAKARMGLPRIDFPATDTATTRSPARVAYDSVRLAWRGSEGKAGALFLAAYPAEKSYRHSIAEERDALRAAYHSAQAGPRLAVLKTMDEAGVLEPFIFFTRADEGIARDYPAFQRDHRDKLRLFWAEFVIGAKYSQ